MKVYRIKKIFISVCLAIIIFSCSKKPPEPIVAKVGKTTIPVSEFRDRFELTPHIQQTPDTKRNERNMLISMLGEKILVEEARDRHLDETEKCKIYSEQAKKEAIIEKLFEDEIASTIVVTPEEVKKGFVRSKVKLNLNVLTFKNEQQAFAAKKEIDAGKSLSQVKRDFQTDSFISTDSVITVTMEWGNSHPDLEEAAYSLNTGDVSEPIFAE